MKPGRVAAVSSRNRAILPKLSERVHKMVHDDHVSMTYDKDRSRNRVNTTQSNISMLTEINKPKSLVVDTQVFIKMRTYPITLWVVSAISMIISIVFFIIISAGGLDGFSTKNWWKYAIVSIFFIISMVLLLFANVETVKFDKLHDDFVWQKTNTF